MSSIEKKEKASVSPEITEEPDQRPTLTSEQQTLAAENIGLVGMHMRKRVPTPKQPTRERDYDDLFQEGCVGLLRAARRYNSKKHGPFAAFALPRVRGAIFSALHEQFSLVHIPMRGPSRTSPSEPRHPGQNPIQDLRDDLTAEPNPHLLEDKSPLERIRHAIHRQFERAVEAALQDLKSKTWRRRNPYPIMQRIAAERILISHEQVRTSLRQIAREAGVSSGRAAAYERKLIDAIGQHFARDPYVRTLVQFAAEDRRGFDGLLDENRRAKLSECELEDFDQRFALMSPAARAECVYAMIEKTSLASAEVARNLYRLFMNDQNRHNDQTTTVSADREPAEDSSTSPLRADSR